MKKIVLLLITLVTLASCTFETYQCPSYSPAVNITKHGEKAQGKYAKRKI